MKTVNKTISGKETISYEKVLEKANQCSWMQQVITPMYKMARS